MCLYDALGGSRCQTKEGPLIMVVIPNHMHAFGMTNILGMTYSQRDSLVSELCFFCIPLAHNRRRRYAQPEYQNDDDQNIPVGIPVLFAFT